ncbi:MAG: DUF4286 family protein [Dehalococcoidia bacterium]
MHKSLLLVYTDVEPEHEEDFNRWYDDVHLPDVLSADGFISARRYKLQGPEPRNQQPASRYLAVYEIDTDDTKAAMASLGAALARVGDRASHPQMRVDSASTYVALGDRQGSGA